MTVKELRAKTGLSQSRFAEHFGLPVRTLQQWEQGIQKPPDYVVAMMERILESAPVRYAQWIPREPDNPESKNFYCSDCKAEINKVKTLYFRFCPECGANMDSKKDKMGV